MHKPSEACRPSFHPSALVALSGTRPCLTPAAAHSKGPSLHSRLLHQAPQLKYRLHVDQQRQHLSAPGLCRFRIDGGHEQSSAVQETTVGSEVGQLQLRQQQRQDDAMPQDQQIPDTPGLPEPPPTSQPLIYDSQTLAKPDLISIVEAGGSIAPKSAPAPAAATELESVAFPSSIAAPPIRSDRLDHPPGSLALKSPRELLISAVSVLGNPLEPLPHEQQQQQQDDHDHADGPALDGGDAKQQRCNASSHADASAMQGDGTLPAAAGADPAAVDQPAMLLPPLPPNSLAAKSQEELLNQALATIVQARDVGIDAVVEATQLAMSALVASARSALLTSAAGLLSASSVGAVDRDQIKQNLDLGSAKLMPAAVAAAAMQEVEPESAAAAAAAVHTQASSSSSSKVLDDGIVLLDGSFDAAACIDGENTTVLLQNTSSSSSNSRSPLANLELSRLEVINYLNSKREVAAQRLMKRTEHFATRLRASVKQTAKELGPSVMQTAVAMIGRRTVVDAVKLIGRENTAVAVGLVGGENAAAATEQLGPGGFAEVSGVLGPKGVGKVVEKLGPIQAAKLGRKLVIDNADLAVSKMREGVRNPKSMRGVLQNLSIKVVWCLWFVWFGVLKTTKEILRGVAYGLLRLSGEDGSSSSRTGDSSSTSSTTTAT